MAEDDEGITSTIAENDDGATSPIVKENDGDHGDHHPLRKGYKSPREIIKNNADQFIIEEIDYNGQSISDTTEKSISDMRSEIHSNRQASNQASKLGHKKVPRGIDRNGNERPVFKHTISYIDPNVQSITLLDLKRKTSYNSSYKDVSDFICTNI